MPLTRRSKVKEAWRHPVGHEMLQAMLRRTGREEKWLQGPLVANRPLQSLDRVAGAGFCDMLVEMASHAPDDAVHVPDERKSWWKEAVVYRIYLPSFMDSDHDGVGDIGGVIQRLPYLERLGVGALWLHPVVDRDDGGGVRNYRKVWQESGGMAGFEQLVKQAHARQMKVILGLDIAATSQEHPWFCEVLDGGDGGYYILKAGTPDAAPNNWAKPGVGSVWQWLPQLSCWGLQLGGAGRMDLNWDNAAVRRDMADVLAFWTEKGVDGFCFGQVNTLSKHGYEDGLPPTGGAGACGQEKYTYGPRMHRYLREMRAAAPAPVLLAGEVPRVGEGMAKLFCGEERAELDMVLDVSPLRLQASSRAEEGVLSLADLKQYYLRWQKDFGSENWMSLFFEGPKTGRLVGRVGASPLYRGTLAKLLGTWLLTMRGTPVVYQGEELGLSNVRYTSPEELRDAVSKQRYAEASARLGDAAAAWQCVQSHLAEHTLAPMPWNAGPNAGFTGAVPWMRLPDGVDYLNAAAQMEDGASVLGHYQKLIALRRQSPCLIYGSFNAVFTKNKRVLCYFRIYEGKKWYVEMNLTEKEVPRPGRITKTQKLELSNYDSPARTLRPYEANLYSCE